MKDCELESHSRMQKIPISNYGMSGNFVLEANSESEAKEWRAAIARQISSITGAAVDPNILNAK